MDTEKSPPTVRSKDNGRIGVFCTFASRALEDAFRQQHGSDSLWLSRFLVVVGMLRVSLFLVADYNEFGVERVFWLLLASRFVFLLLSVWVLFCLRRIGSAAAAERLFLLWCFLLVAMTVYALSTRPPNNNRLFLMSFGMIVAIYCVTPLPLFRQAVLSLTYSAAALFVCRQVDGETFSMVGFAFAISNLFGVLMSWRLNLRRREMFLAALREAELRTDLEAAVAEVKTLRGLLCMCAWCKRIRDEKEDWESVEAFVQRRTHASFSHGICPDCLQTQLTEISGLTRSHT